MYVAEDGERIVARLSLARDVHPASGHVADLGLMVAASHRRRGVGRALLEQAVAWAGASGIRKLELHVFPWNEPAIALYESFGFEREGLRKGHYLRDGVPVDAILMALQTRPAVLGSATPPARRLLSFMATVLRMMWIVCVSDSVSSLGRRVRLPGAARARRRS